MLASDIVNKFSSLQMFLVRCMHLPVVLGRGKGDSEIPREEERERGEKLCRAEGSSKTRWATWRVSDCAPFAKLHVRVLPLFLDQSPAQSLFLYLPSISNIPVFDPPFPVSDCLFVHPCFDPPFDAEKRGSQFSFRLKSQIRTCVIFSASFVRYAFIAFPLAWKNFLCTWAFRRLFSTYVVLRRGQMYMSIVIDLHSCTLIYRFLKIDKGGHIEIYRITQRLKGRIPKDYVYTQSSKDRWIFISCIVTVIVSLGKAILLGERSIYARIRVSVLWMLRFPPLWTHNDQCPAITALNSFISSVIIIVTLNLPCNTPSVFDYA